MHLRYALTSAIGAAALFTCAQASATTLTGPVFPPPGGVSFSSNGTLAIDPGRVATYQGFDLSASSSLYFGIYAAGLAMDGTIDPSEALTFDAALSNLGNGIAVYSGTTTVNNFGSNQTAYDRLTLTFTDFSNNPLALALNPDAGGGLFPVLNVQGNYHVGQGFTASSSLNGSYTAASTYFNSLNTPNVPNLLRSSLSGGFYYSVAAVPEASTWAMMLLGFGAIGISLRRSRRRAPPIAQVA